MQSLLRSALLAVFLAQCLHHGILEAKMLSATLPWFSYAGVIEDLGQHLRENIPPDHRNVVVFARKVTVAKNVDFNLTKFVLPEDLTVVCEELHITPGTCTLDMGCKDSPDMISFNDKKDKDPLKGIDGCNGGSFTLFAKTKTGPGFLSVDTRGGNGGKGQDGYKGSRGSPGADRWWTGDNGGRGENGGDGAPGGKAGNAGYVGIALRNEDPSNMFRDVMVHTVGGQGGAGGAGGTAGKGGPGGKGTIWANGDTGPSGTDGSNGDPGASGNPSVTERRHVGSDTEFYQMLPIDGGQLHRALNTEIYRIFLAKHEDDTNLQTEIETTLNWIGRVATENGYDTVQRRCTEMLELFSDENDVQFDDIEVENSDIQDCFNDIHEVVRMSVNLEPAALTQAIQDDPLLKKHSNFARGFNKLGRQHREMVSRCEIADDIADEVTGETPPPPATRQFLDTPFDEHLSDKIKEIAATAAVTSAVVTTQQAVQTINAATALQTFASVASKTAAIGETDLAAGTAIAVDAELLAAGAAAASGVVVGAAVVFVIYEAYVHVQANIEQHKMELRKYEDDLLEQAKRLMENEPKLKQDIDQKEPVPFRPPNVRPIPRIPEPRNRPDSPNPPQPIPVPSGLSSNFLGVLSECEPVENSNDKVVATFDAISIQLTKVGEDPENVDLKDISTLDPIQKGELFAQLEIYKLPLSILPSFFLTTTLTTEVNCDDDRGKWFEFEVTFESDGQDQAIAIIPIVTYSIGKIFPSIATFADSQIPITIKKSSIEAVNEDTQDVVVTTLGLSSPPTRKKRQGPGFLFHNIVRAAYNNKIRANNPMANTMNIRSVLVANVGQGNMNILYQGNRIKAVFDFGHGYETGKMTPEQEQDIVNEINADSPTMILSHWDLDHFNLLLRYPTLTDGKTFILPSHGSNRGNAVNRVYRMMIPSRNRVLIYPSYQAIVTRLELGNVKLSLTSASRSSGKNHYAAITACIYRGIRPNFLLPGDARYGSIYAPHKRGLRSLVATHHGSSNRIGAIPTARDNDGTVIFSYGQANRHGHDVANVAADYTAAGWITQEITVNSGRGVTQRVVN